jgi:pimeloyl-ACP methyl ester carboxylesterase
MIARHALTLIVAAGIFFGSACHRATTKEAGKTGATPPYQVYLLKGLADIFSTGLDFLQAKLQARGVVGEVHSHAAAEELAQSAIAKWRGGGRGPIIIIGHSLGADAAMTMAQRLGAAGVPVALLVTFSPVDSAPVSANVARAVNYFQSSSAFHGQITKGAGFHGALENVDLAETPGITHWNIEKAESLHAATIAKVLMLIPTHTRAAATAPPAGAPATDRSNFSVDTEGIASRRRGPVGPLDAATRPGYIVLRLSCC